MASARAESGRVTIFERNKRQPGGDEEHDHGEQQQQAHVGAAHEFALASEIVVALLAGFDLAHGLRKFARKRNRHQNHASARNGSAAQSVVGLLPGELRGMPGDGVGQRESGL